MQSPIGQPNPSPVPRWIDIDPRASNLRPIHPVGVAHWDAGFLPTAQRYVPFDQSQSDHVQAIQVVEYNGEYIVFSGHHRIYALRNLHVPPHPPAPATVRVQVFTPQEFATSSEADTIFQGNVSVIEELIQGTIAANATFPIL